MSVRKSIVWSYFDKKNAAEAKCLKCGVILSCKGSSTSALRNHMKLRHNMLLNDNQAEDTTATSSKIRKVDQTLKHSILTFAKKDTLDSILARCAAEDGFSINAITKLLAIKGFVESRGFNMPTSNNTVMKHVLCFYEEKKNELKAFFENSKKNHLKFSMSEDEWSDIQLRRYIGITIYGDDSSSVLGLIPIEGNYCLQFTLNF